MKVASKFHRHQGKIHRRVGTVKEADKIIPEENRVCAEAYGMLKPALMFEYLIQEHVRPI